jgi:hypothetical protein
MIAKANFPDKRIYAAIVLFTLVGVVGVTVYRALERRRRGRPDVVR